MVVRRIPVLRPAIVAEREALPYPFDVMNEVLKISVRRGQ